MFFFGDFAVYNWPPEHTTEVLFCVPKSKKIMMCLIERILVLDKRCSDLSYSAVGYESMLMNQKYVLNKMSLH